MATPSMSHEPYSPASDLCSQLLDQEHDAALPDILLILRIIPHVPSLLYACSVPSILRTNYDRLNRPKNQRRRKPSKVSQQRRVQPFVCLRSKGTARFQWDLVVIEWGMLSLFRASQLMMCRTLPRQRAQSAWHFRHYDVRYSQDSLQFNHL